MLHSFSLFPFPRTLSSSSPVPPRHHCASVSPVRVCCVMAIAIHPDQCSSPSHKRDHPRPSGVLHLPFCLLFGRHPLEICPVMRSPSRGLGETRTVTVDAHGIWLLRMCASLGYFFTWCQLRSRKIPLVSSQYRHHPQRMHPVESRLPLSDSYI